MRAVWYDRQGPAADVIQTGDLPTSPHAQRKRARTDIAAWIATKGLILSVEQGGKIGTVVVACAR